MRYLAAVIFICFAYIKVSAQKAVTNIDTINYLLDTVNTPLNDRMWDIGIESRYKYFTIKCPCFKFDSYPTFVYNIKESGDKLDIDLIPKLKFTNLSSLIDLAKKTTDLTAKTLYTFYIIEKIGRNEYTSHKVRLLTPRKREVSIDYENVPADTNKRKNK